MTGPLRPDAADMLGRGGRHWGWLLAFGLTEISVAMRIRSARHHRPGPREAHAA